MNPWSTGGKNYYFTYTDSGSTSSAFNFNYGYTCNENEGKVMAMLDSDGTPTIVGWGVLGAKAKRSVLKADMDVYPGYTGDLEAEGKVTATFNDDYMFQFPFDIKGLKVDCADCGSLLTFMKEPCVQRTKKCWAIPGIRR
jgi:hypothetical protein